MPSTLLTGLLLSLLISVAHAAAYPEPVEGDYVIGNFAFSNGDRIPELKVHYRTIGALTRDETGLITNAVLLLAGNAGGVELLDEGFAGALFGADQPLDARRYFLILPDSIGNSTPGDATGATFSRDNARDAVTALYRLVLNHLG